MKTSRFWHLAALLASASTTLLLVQSIAWLALPPRGELAPTPDSVSAAPQGDYRAGLPATNLTM